MVQKTEKRQNYGRGTNQAEVASIRQERDDTRTGTRSGTLKQAILDNLFYVQGIVPELATKNDWYMAVAYTVRDRLIEHFIRWMKDLWRPDAKIVSYLSTEFLMGPHLGNNLLNMGLTDRVREALKELGLGLDMLYGFSCVVECSRDRIRHKV